VLKDGLIAKARAAIKHTKATGGTNSTDLMDYLRRSVMMEEPRPGANIALTTFDHTINQNYASRYYAYQWSLVYAQDVFTEFQKHGIMDKETGARYRKYILEPSGLNTGMQKLENFLGREPNEDAYFDLNGFS
jgi:Zn-dependent oligopeptidase